MGERRGELRVERGKGTAPSDIRITGIRWTEQERSKYWGSVIQVYSKRRRLRLFPGIIML
jgi:hypothetical protein